MSASTWVKHLRCMLLVASVAKSELLEIGKTFSNACSRANSPSVPYVRDLMPLRYNDEARYS